MRDDAPSKPSLTTLELRRRLRVAILTPLTVLLVVGGLLALQVARLSENASWFQHSAIVLASAFEVQKLIVDQETGLRGFLVTRDQLFLEPFRQSQPERAFDRLAEEVDDNPTQARRVAEARARYRRWHAAASSVLEELPGQAGSPGRMRERKVMMDAVRSTFSEITGEESDLRAERAAHVATSVGFTRVALVVLLGAAALVIALVSRRNLGSVASTFEDALSAERTAREYVEAQQWIRLGQVTVAEAAQGDRPIDELSSSILRAIVRYTGAQAGAFFAVEAAGLKRVAGYGLPAGEAHGLVARGEGLVGRAVLEEEPLHVRDVPREYFPIGSASGALAAGELVLGAARADSVPYAVIELGFLQRAPAGAVELVEAVSNKIALAVRSAEYKARLRELLEESRQQSEELRAQQEELRVANEELTEQSRALEEAQARLEEQREELSASNERLRERTHALESAQVAVEQKAAELERASKYKSEFLANMSHELRTPLNSALILAGLLAENRQGNLTPEQIKFANTIHMAGSDLLSLINDILDLSKVEAGHLEVVLERVDVASMLEHARRLFEPIAREKGLRFELGVDTELPGTIVTDHQRVQQIVKNLLSNAFKFTQNGGVSLQVKRDGDALLLSVRDTGIGIAPEHHGTVFEAFRQADGTTNRKFGGTGLGLTIARDLARLLGGDLTLDSQLGEGSCFTLRLPLDASDKGAERVKSGAERSPGTGPARVVAPHAAMPGPTNAPRSAAKELSGSPHSLTRTAAQALREASGRAAPLLLVIEDDPIFAGMLAEAARKIGFESAVAGTAEHGLLLARERLPQAIILDMHLPDHSGLTVLDRIKRDPLTRPIPVHVMSASDHAQQALSMGAIGYLIKPVTTDALADALGQIQVRLKSDTRRVLVVEDDEGQRAGICALLADMGAEITAVGTVGEALTELRARAFDCVVTDLTLPDASGHELIETMAEDESYPFPPLIVYTGRSLSQEEEASLRRHSSSIIVKGVRSPERLLDEVALFLHKVEGELPAERQRALQHVRERDAAFDGKTVLIAEDDVRNVFALTALLEPRGVKLRIARNGRDALDSLAADPAVDIVLMDIMMPEVDGLTAIRTIRKEPWGRSLPIIALTAKAMKADQQACLDAGASDYIAKPLDVDTLLSLMRVWMGP